jgi:hypothetical protein
MSFIIGNGSERSSSGHDVLTAGHFLHPTHPAQRKYEILRARFVEGLTLRQIAERFECGVKHTWSLCGRNSPDAVRRLFAPLIRAGTRKPDFAALREMVIEWRKQNYSVHDISRFAREHGRPLSPAAAWRMLNEAGFARLPRRADDERPRWAKAEAAPYADVNALDLSPGGQRSSRWGGVLLFLPLLAEIRLDRLVSRCAYPGSKMVPGLNSLLSLLAMKLMSRERRPQVLDVCEDAGPALLAGLNVLPKTTFLSDYSYRMGPTPHRKLIAGIDQALHQKGWMSSRSFNLDFHAIPYYGEEGRLEKNYVPRRSHAEHSILTFFAQECQSRAICYANANLLNKEHSQEILRFVDFWEATTGRPPLELAFDSRLTTYQILGALDRRKIRFLTLQARGTKIVRELRNIPRKEWTQCTLDVPQRKYKHPLVYEQAISIKGCSRKLRRIAAINLGREEPTLLLTNDFDRKPAALLTRYAQRTLIENGLNEAVNFFHVDALSSSIRIKVDLDCVLTTLASLCYQWLARQIKGFESAQAKTLWRRFVDRPATIFFSPTSITVRFNRHNHAPLLIEAGFARRTARIPWLANLEVRYEFR